MTRLRPPQSRKNSLVLRRVLSFLYRACLEAYGHDSTILHRLEHRRLLFPKQAQVRKRCALPEDDRGFQGLDPALLDFRSADMSGADCAEQIVSNTIDRLAETVGYCGALRYYPRFFVFDERLGSFLR